MRSELWGTLWGVHPDSDDWCQMDITWSYAWKVPLYIHIQSHYMVCILHRTLKHLWYENTFLKTAKNVYSISCNHQLPCLVLIDRAICISCCRNLFEYISVRADNFLSLEDCTKMDRDIYPVLSKHLSYFLLLIWIMQELIPLPILWSETNKRNGQTHWRFNFVARPFPELNWLHRGHNCWPAPFKTGIGFISKQSPTDQIK